MTHILHDNILLHGMVVVSTYFDHHGFKDFHAELSCTPYALVVFAHHPPICDELIPNAVVYPYGT